MCIEQSRVTMLVQVSTFVFQVFHKFYIRSGPFRRRRLAPQMQSCFFSSDRVLKLCVAIQAIAIVLFIGFAVSAVVSMETSGGSQQALGAAASPGQEQSCRGRSYTLLPLAFIAGGLVHSKSFFKVAVPLTM